MKTLALKTLTVILFAGALAFGAGVGSPDDIPDQVLLTETNHVLMRGPVTDESVSKLIDQLAELIEKRGGSKKPLYIVLDTPGGSVPAGYKLYEFLKGYSNIHTLTINSYSMGAILVEMIEGKRLILETGTIMFHRMAVSDGRPRKVEEITKGAEYFKSMEDFATDKVAERTGIPYTDLQKEFDAELYMTGNIAVKRNFADKVVSAKCSKELIKKKLTTLIQPVPFLPPMEIEVPACPLL